MSWESQERGERKALYPESGRLLEADLVPALHGREIKAVPHALANTVEVHFSAAIDAVQLALRGEAERVVVVVVAQVWGEVVVGVDEVARALRDLARHQVRAVGEGERPPEHGDVHALAEPPLHAAGGRVVRVGEYPLNGHHVEHVRRVAAGLPIRSGLD